ncbi:MAG: hypothetical protein WBG62_01175, partial [Cyclobacteriaceae bacterium]
MKAINTFRINYTLRQHTPIIHFQHDHYGATLRATEVKPKLDRFLRDKMPTMSNLKEHAHLADKVRRAMKNKQSLYKMAFEASAESNYYVPVSQKINKDELKAITQKQKISVVGMNNTTYFANEEATKDLPQKVDKLDKLRVALQAKGDNAYINGHIICFDKPLRECIEKVLPYFFAYENFGTRQNKGFGCFEVMEVRDKEITHTHEELLRPLYTIIYRKRIREDSQRNASQWQKTTKNDYDLLKRGAPKKTSKLKKHFAKDEIGWEKDWLKGKAAGNRNLIDDNYRFIRAVLGLPGMYDIQPGKTKISVKVKDTDTSEHAIDRFRSPITFKVYDDVFY